MGMAKLISFKISFSGAGACPVHRLLWLYSICSVVLFQQYFIGRMMVAHFQCTAPVNTAFFYTEIVLPNLLCLGGLAGRH